METIKLMVGKDIAVNGRYQDFRRPVSFEGEKLAEYSYLTGDDDTRGHNETLYRASDGRLIVHMDDWSRWQGEPSYSRLVEVKPEDLDAVSYTHLTLPTIYSV